MIRVGVVVVAAGSGIRFGGDTPKQFLPLAGMPLAAHSIRTFRALPEVREVAVVLPRKRFDDWSAQLAPFLEGDGLSPVRFAPGGAARQDSSFAGLEALGGDCNLLAVHDAARPGVDAALIRRVFAAAQVRGAAIPATRPADTLWRTRDGQVAEAVDRERIAAAQTPQCFRPDVLLPAFAAARRAGFSGSDEASLVRKAGHPVAVVEGGPGNLKVTEPGDLDVLRFGAPPSRTGFGYDAHRFVAEDGGAPLVLGGVAFPGEPRLEGHSDGDALLHALTDAILGAVAAGEDIGGLFPSTDASLRGAASERFVKRALEIAAESGYRPGQADLTVIGERPRLTPRALAIRERVGALLALPPDAIGFKATTTDRMGFVGQGEGLAAHALVRMDPA